MTVSTCSRRLPPGGVPGGIRPARDPVSVPLALPRFIKVYPTSLDLLHDRLLDRLGSMSPLSNRSGAAGLVGRPAKKECNHVDPYRDQILKRLEQAREETPQALGLSGDGGVIEVLVSPEGGWTILLTYPRRPTCVIATGEPWEMQLAGQPA
jgi:hypothetical protein